ncbi:MAG: glycosyltransferase family 2 protein [Deltaproteobacteria bacterium]|nr:glycosyltransferase family 2 protein [Deltaproteobacteria bacterium]
MSFDFENLRRITEWQWLLLLAPALLFDTTRYYLTNFLYSLFSLFQFFLPKKKDRRGTSSDSPMVSILLPVYNEGPDLREVLDSILGNLYPNFELLVIDDASSDETRGLCLDYQARGKLRYFRKRIRGSKPSSLNYGLFFARGDYVLHLDGDTRLERSAILEMMKAVQDPRVGGVAGNLFARNARQNLTTLLQSAEFAMTINAQRRWLAPMDLLQIASGAFSLFKKKIMVRSRGVDPEYGEDLDITIKARKMGARIAFAPDAIAETALPPTMGGLFRQRLRWDRCYVRLNLRKHGNLINLLRFRLGDFVCMVLDFFFNLVLLLFFPVYLVWVEIKIPGSMPFILVVTYLFYTLVIFTQITISFFLSPKKHREWRWFLTVPVYFLYSLYLRIIRASAYLLEAFRSKRGSSRFFPDYVRSQIPRY